MKLELFHVVSDPASARVRRFVVDHELEAHVRFRNLNYDEVARDFTGHGGSHAPALWDGENFFEGPDAVIARLKAVTDLGRAP